MIFLLVSWTEYLSMQGHDSSDSRVLPVSAEGAEAFSAVINP